MTCHLSQNIFFREFARLFRETYHFRGIQMFCFREIMLPLKYVIQTIPVSEDLNLLFSGDWNVSFFGNCNTSIFGGLNSVIFRRLKDVIFGRLKCVILRRWQYVIFGRWQCAIFGRLKCAIFGRLKCIIFGRLKCIIFGRLNYFLKLRLKYNFRAFRNNAFRIFKNYFKNYSKSYSNCYYYFHIIILLTLSSMSPFGFLFVIFFSVRATTLNFFEFYFYALRRFLANFQAYIASSGQKLFQTAWKQVPKKAKKNQNVSKSESDKKEHIKLPIFVLLKSFILPWSKSLKSFKLTAFMVLERFLGSHLWPLLHSSPSLPYTERIHRGHMK